MRLSPMVLLACLVSCAAPHAPAPRPGACPFEPVSLRIHPLTHVEPSSPRVPPDQCLLVLHLELRDRYADAVKGLGALRIEVSRPGAGPTPAPEAQALVWQLPEFADPDANASRYDPATGTYRVPLLAPRWVAHWLDPEQGTLRAGAPARLRVRATLTTNDQRLLADEFVIQR
jgi:hypothetical protein